MLRINHNYNVYVKLNDIGKNMYIKYWESVVKYTLDEVEKAKDEDGFWKFQIHNFMEIFGGERNYAISPFEGGELYFKEKDLTKTP